MNLGRRGMWRRTRRATTSVAARASRLTAIIAMIFLVLQLLAAPYHQALATGAGPSTAGIAAELRATFGNAATLCGKTTDNGAPVSPASDCDDRCPFCRFAAQTAALVAPDSSALPVRLDAARRILIGIEAIASARHRVGIDVGREDLQLDLAFRGVDLLAKEHGEGISFLAGTATGRRPYQALPELTAELAKIGR